MIRNVRFLTFIVEIVGNAGMGHFQSDLDQA
jgi:hypothetical protein